VQTIAIANQKGGAGKSPTAVHLAYALANAGNKVLFVDLDPQATASLHFLGKKYKQQQPTIYNALINLQPITPININEHLFLLPAHDELERAEIELTAKKGAFYQAQLTKLLQKYSGYDYCIIDTPGSRVSVFTVLALTAAQLVIIPVKTEIAHLEATIDTMNMIEDVKAGLNPKLQIWGLLPNQYESGTGHHREVLEMLQEEYADLVYSEPSRKTTRYNDATAMRADVRQLDPALGTYWDTIAASIISAGEKVQR
jgi:chromosome partitioning protein